MVEVMTDDKKRGKWYSPAREKAIKKYQRKMKDDPEFKKKSAERTKSYKERIKAGITIPVSECKEFVLELDKNLPKNSEDYRAGVVVMFGSLNGIHNVNKIAFATGYPNAFVFVIYNNLINNGIWKDGKAYFEYFLSEDVEYLEQVIEFWLIVAVALGEIVKIEDKYGIE